MLLETWGSGARVQSQRQKACVILQLLERRLLMGFLLFNLQGPWGVEGGERGRDGRSVELLLSRGGGRKNISVPGEYRIALDMVLSAGVEAEISV